MTTGKIKTLFSDKENTEALFPRTKVSAVSDADGTGLDAILDDLNSEISTKATEAFVTNKIAEAQLSGGSGGNIDLSGYATKDDIRNIDFPVDSVNGKTGAVTLSAADVGARPDTWMPSATEVGALPTTGGKVTGDITVEKGIPAFRLDTTDSSAAIVKNANVGVDYGTFIEDLSSDGRKAALTLDAKYGINDALRFYLSSVNAEYNVLHTGNKNLITPADIGAVNKKGDTMTGNLTVPGFTVFAGHNWPTVVLTNNANLLPRIELSSNFENKQFYFINRHDPNNENNYEVFDLPNATTSGSNWYSILTTKAPVAVRQGGTGATDAATARANLGAAPAGYGLGEYAPFITDANEAILPGFYRFDSSKTCANIPSEWQFPYGTMIVSRGSAYIEQLFLAREINAKRTCTNGTWGEWEYLNPPMNVGVEYRTTERWNGVPVYTMLADLGATSESLSVTAPVPGIYRLIRAIPVFGDGRLCTEWDANSGVNPINAFYFCPEWTSGGVFFYVKCGSNRTGKNLKAQIWYTKS